MNEKKTCEFFISYLPGPHLQVLEL